MKAQEPWIGKRGRIGVIIPSTNIGVEYDCQRIIPEGVTWHFARFFVSQPDLSSDDMFLAFIEAIRETIPDAMREIVIRMLGSLDAANMLILSYYFGNSHKH